MHHYRLAAWFAVGFGLLASFGIGCRSVESIARVPHVVAGVFHRHPPASEFAKDPTHLAPATSTRAETASVSKSASPTDPAALAFNRKGEARAESLAQSALANWSILTDELSSNSEKAAAWQAYHRDLKSLLQDLMDRDQLDPTQSISLTSSDGSPKTIRIELHGFAWTAQDFNQFDFAAGTSHTESKQKSKLARYWEEPGLGIPLVALRIRENRETYQGRIIPIATTAVLRPVSNHRVAQVSHQSEIAVLHLYNPLSTLETEFGNRNYRLYRDLSAPLAHALGDINRSNIRDFMSPDHQHEGVGLCMLSPYQPGKIPVVFIHGLLSDRLTWIDLVNDLRAVPWFNDRYQVWSYQYPTGQAFIRSGAEMRSALRKTIDDLDPDQTDAALSQMVLVGHSMGGLVSKLQISHSGSSLWQSIANRPVSHLAAPDDIKEQIRSMFFFEPQPFVARAVFIGTPHRGSDWATSIIGRFGSSLVHQPEDRVTALHDLMNNNPHVFVDQVEDRLPTSIDLLRPDSPLLQSTYSLPVASRVTTHSIIGTGKALKDSTPADGVVPVANARHPNTASERYIDTTHTRLPDHPQTTEELTKILREHLLAFDANETTDP